MAIHISVDIIQLKHIQTSHTSTAGVVVSLVTDREWMVLPHDLLDEPTP